MDVPWVRTGSVSLKFRRTNWSFPSVVASANFSASSGVTSKVMTSTEEDRSSIPLFSFVSEPTAKTRIFSRIVLVTGAGALPVAQVVSTSARVPG